MLFLDMDTETKQNVLSIDHLDTEPIFKVYHFRLCMPNDSSHAISFLVFDGLVEFPHEVSVM